MFTPMGKNKEMERNVHVLKTLNLSDSHLKKANVEIIKNHFHKKTDSYVYLVSVFAD